MFIGNLLWPHFEIRFIPEPGLLCIFFINCANAAVNVDDVIRGFYVFGSIVQWKLGDYMFIFIFANLSYGLRNIFMGSFRGIPWMIVNGQLDSVLTKPINILLYISGSGFGWGRSHIWFYRLRFLFYLPIYSTVDWGFIEHYSVPIGGHFWLVGSRGYYTGHLLLWPFYMMDVKSIDNLYSGFREFIWYPLNIFNRLFKLFYLQLLPFYAMLLFVPSGIFLETALILESTYRVVVFKSGRLGLYFWFIVSSVEKSTKKICQFRIINKKRALKMVIKVENLSKHYIVHRRGTGILGLLRSVFKPERSVVEAVKEISFSVSTGEIVGFIGPNGAGKSTTIKMITGILLPTSGFIETMSMDPF